MRMILCICIVIVIGSRLSGQESIPSANLSIGTPKTSVDAALGKRFGLFKVEANDSNGKIGAPTGTWDVYHLTAPHDRMYVTILHFGGGSESDSASGRSIDSLILMPAESATVAQILEDQPAFASVCKMECEIVLVTNHAGNRSLLLRPKGSRAETVLFFDGDSAGKWKSVLSMESVVSWAYAIPKAAFEEHHQAANDRVIGSWSPGAAEQK